MSATPDELFRAYRTKTRRPLADDTRGGLFLPMGPLRQLGWGGTPILSAHIEVPPNQTDSDAT
jgi:hypothetical protein